MAEKSDEDLGNEDVSATNSGRITFNQVKFVGVEYPGYIKDENQMLETLGGEETVAKTYSSPGRRLELSFRPDDPYCHAVCGDRYSTPNLLLRVKQRKKKSRDGSNEPKVVKYEQEILGIVANTFKFEVLADFQYLVPDMPEFLKEVKDADALDQDIPLHLPPPVFARFDKPQNYNYQSVPHSNKQENNTDEESSTGTSTRMRRPANAMAVNFSMAEIPSSPNPKAVEIATKTKDVHLETIKKLFTTRPIWSKTALLCHMNGVSNERLKNLLAYVAFYWINGPWRTLWNRLGYDPRKDPSAKIYQMLDYRIGSRKETRDLPIKAKRDSSVYILPNLIKKGGTSKTLVKEVVRISSDDKASEEQTQEQEYPYVFTPDKMPKQKQLFYQLCDLHDPEIQGLISRNDGQEDELLDRDGWCLPGTANEIREILHRRTADLAERFKQQQSGMGEEVEQTTSQLQLTGEEWTGHEGVKNFLELLEKDDDIEAYDIFDDVTEGDE